LIDEAQLQAVEPDDSEEALFHLHHHAEDAAFVVANIRLPYLMGGVEFARLVCLRWPRIRIMVTLAGPNGRPCDLPRMARCLPRPFRALDLPMEIEQDVGCVPHAHSSTFDSRKAGSLQGPSVASSCRDRYLQMRRLRGSSSGVDAWLNCHHETCRSNDANPVPNE
jgi:hypothetical protein